MHLSSQSLFLLLFVLIARVSLAADLDTKDQTLIATPTHAPEVLRRYFARGDKSNDDDGHEATIFDCTTKVIVEVPANAGKKDDANTRKEVKCTPTAIFIPASPTASAATRSNKKVTVTVTAKATPTPQHSSNLESSSSSGHKNDDKEGGSTHGSGTTHDKEQSPKDNDDTVTAYTESGPGTSSSTPTAGIEDPNAPNDNSEDTSGSDPNGTDDATTDTEGSDDTTTTPNDSDDSASTTDNGDDTTTGTSNPNESSSESPNAQDPNTRSETQAVEGTVSNKALGIGLGVGIGCVAAIGLAGLLVANKRRRENQSSSSSYNDDVNTHWRPQSFMGVVASVVAKLPRSASLRSNQTKRDTAGMAVGAGQGAIEDPSTALGRHPSNSSSRSAASQPPSLARVHEQPREQMHEIDLRY
ncbi:hypothetical protein BDA99DRAFT_122209 [Phascolomyces articulosus]|uniref:Mid2 domain-containing protein n=1 Tax=Phascolomyces articulosus TaxID=60185 RepID=A0AAD5PIN8_9FUNG|nr:hypothetical protein BDA99DRAFT_122209 [Phascolomyces articulosus]